METNSSSSINNQTSLDQEQIPQGEHVEKASKFINETSLDEMLEIAEIARRKKLTEPPKWVIPDEI